MWLSAASASTPRSSTNHSTLVPAESITASAPHVSSPPRLQATIGNVPCGWRWALAGAEGPVQVSSMPPVPKVTFVRPGWTQP